MTGRRTYRKKVLAFGPPEGSVDCPNRDLRREKETIYPLRYTFRALKKDGSIAWVDLRGMAARYLGRPANIGTVVDITEQKETEEELKRHRSQLEKRVRERTDGTGPGQRTIEAGSGGS